ncbi:MAG: capsule assembly Wzi family protein [Acidaminococcaceae bacterium]
MAKKIYAAVAACLLGANVVYAQAPKVTANVPLSSASYVYIEKLSGMGYLQSMPMGAKPYSRLDMAKWTLEARAAAAQKPMPEYLAATLQELERDLAPEIAELQGNGRAENIKLRQVSLELASADSDQSSYGYNSPAHKIPASWQPLNHGRNGYLYGDNGNIILGAEISGRVGNETIVSVAPRFSYDEEQNGHASIREGYLKTRSGALGFEVGKQPVAWGQGVTGNFVLGDNAKPLTMARMNFLEPQKIGGFFKFLGSANVNILYGELDGNRKAQALANGDRNDYDNAGLLGLRADFAPTANFTFGVSRVSMLGGDGNGLSLSDWGDWLVGANANTSEDDRWNDIAGFDFRYRFPGLQVYGELYGEDQAGYLPSKTAERLGFYFPQITRDGSWELRTEYAHTTNVWYDHWNYQNGWVYNNGLIGDAMGPDAQKIYLGAQRYIDENEKLGINFMRTDMERSLAAAQQVDEFWLSYNCKLDKTIYLDAMLGVAKIDNAGYAKGRSDRSALASVVVRWTY